MKIYFIPGSVQKCISEITALSRSLLSVGAGWMERQEAKNGSPNGEYGLRISESNINFFGRS